MRNWFSRHLLLAGLALGIALSGAVGVIGGLCVIEFGWFDVGAATPHSKLVAWAVHTTMIHAVKNATKPESGSAKVTPKQIRHGFHEYEEHCVICHGGPGVGRARWVRGLNPTPPFLLDAAQQWSPAELRFIVTHGIKMTAMPAWALSQSDRDLNDIVAFLKQLPNVSAARYAAMQRADRAAESTGH